MEVWNSTGSMESSFTSFEMCRAKLLRSSVLEHGPVELLGHGYLPEKIVGAGHPREQICYRIP